MAGHQTGSRRSLLIGRSPREVRSGVTDRTSEQIFNQVYLALYHQTPGPSVNTVTLHSFTQCFLLLLPVFDLTALTARC